MSDAARSKNQYFFGRTLARQVDFFAFPRTGAHFFRHCTAGLFDLVALPTPAVDNPEAVSRQDELDPEVLYALDLREDGVPYQPVRFNPLATGQHGPPAKGESPVVILSREPMATAYSLWRSGRDRPGFMDMGTDHAAFLGGALRRYHEFCVKARDVLVRHPLDTLVIRYERLRVSPEPLEQLVRLVGVRPKLRPSFVHRLTRFETMVAPGARTFYRQGDDRAWLADEPFRAMVARLDVPDFSGFDFVEPTPR